MESTIPKVHMGRLLLTAKCSIQSMWHQARREGECLRQAASLPLEFSRYFLLLVRGPKGQAVASMFRDEGVGSKSGVLRGVNAFLAPGAGGGACMPSHKVATANPLCVSRTP
jgi:hypothetical protein